VGVGAERGETLVEPRCRHADSCRDATDDQLRGSDIDHGQNLRLGEVALSDIQDSAAGVIIFHRRPKLLDHGLRRYRIVLDGEPIAFLTPGSSLRLAVEPGWHEVFIRLDLLWRSPPLRIEVPADTTYELRVGPHRGPPLLALFRPARYLSLKPVSTAAA
jgi:hypothetical protein